MIINDLDSIRPILCPDEADPVLIVDANAVLASPISAEGFEAVRRWRPEVVEGSGGIPLVELPAGYSPERHGACPPGMT